MRSRIKTIGILAIFIMLASLMATSGLAALRVVEGNTTDVTSYIGPPLNNISSSNLTIESFGTWSDDAPILSDIVECNMTIGKQNEFNGINTSITFTTFGGLSTSYINMSKMNISNVYFEWTTLEDGIYWLTDVVCLNLTGGDTDNASVIAQDIYIDRNTPSQPVISTRDDVMFDRKSIVELVFDMDAYLNTSQCVVVFSGGKFPNNIREWTFNTTSNNSCAASWPSNYLVDGIYRYTVAGSDGLNISVNFSDGQSSDIFYEFHLKESISSLNKLLALKGAGYEEINTAEGRIDLKNLAIFGGEDGATSTNNMVLLVIGAIVIYVLFFHKKKK